MRKALRKGTARMEKICVENLEMVYDGEIALDKVSFTVREGEFLSILGPSGCGKSTLLRIMIGLLKPTGGIIRKDGRDITSAAPSARGMGMVFQNYALFENMTVLGNVEYAQKIRKENKGRQARAQVREKAMELIRLVNLEDHADKYPAELSGGQQQRVAIARTLMMNPDVLLFDEPTSALDAASRHALRTEIKRLQRETGVTILYVTHDQEEAIAMSDRIMVMRDTKIVQIDTPQTLLTSPKDAYVQEFVIDSVREKLDSLRVFFKDSENHP